MAPRSRQKRQLPDRVNCPRDPLLRARRNNRVVGPRLLSTRRPRRGIFDKPRIVRDQDRRGRRRRCAAR